jgi:hypothetical protein
MRLTGSGGEQKMFDVVPVLLLTSSPHSTEMNKTRKFVRRILAGVVSAVLGAVFVGARLDAAPEPEKEKEEEARREEQLKNMKRSAAQHALTSPDDPKRTFKFHESALLRFSNPVSGTKDGGIYVWTDAGRPQAILKLYTFDNKFFTHEWLSLSENTLIAERDGKAIWTPAEPGLKFRELPEAPKPAGAAADRLRQMKALATGFSATYTARHLDGKPFELRLLAQPLFRYETDEKERADGSVFGFVQSTAPVVLLILESRPTKDGQRWHYACASLVSGPVTAKYGDKEVFSLEKNYARNDPKNPYLQLHRLPVPKE